MDRSLRAAFLASAVAAVACHAPAAIQTSPSHGGLFGQTTVTFDADLSKIGTVQSITVGGIAAYDLDAGPSSVTATIQGAPTPGAADVVVTGSKGTLTDSSAFTYEAPAAHVPLVWVAFGASLTMGFQSLGLSVHSQTHSAAADIAGAAGVYLGIPLFNADVLPQLTLSDFTDMNGQCVQTSGGLSIGAGAVANPASARVDPTLQHPRNTAAGGSDVDDILNGGMQLAVAFQENVVEDPQISPGDVFNPPSESQIDRVVAFDPDVGLSMDLLANDIDGSVTASDDLHPEVITPVGTLAPLLQTLMSRLGALHGQFFIANLPYLTFIPNVAALKTQTLMNGTETEETFDAKVQEINDDTDQFNAAMVAAMAPYPNLHIVDFHDAVANDLTQGVTVDGQTLTVAMFGGLLSLDGLHFTDTGNGILANLFIGAMNPVLGTSIPQVDLSALLAQDPLSPASLRAVGFPCAPMP